MPNKELISKSELLTELEKIEDSVRQSRLATIATPPNSPAMYNYDVGRKTMLDIIIRLVEDWGEEKEPEPDIPADYFRPM